ncbi:hypothetical protein D3C71_1765410 [compost metagenome]
MRTQLLTGLRRTGKGHRILIIQMFKHIADATAYQLQRALWHQTAVDNQSDHRLRQLRRGGRRFDDRRHAGQPGGRQFFQHPPAGKVKSINMQRHARA